MISTVLDPHLAMVRNVVPQTPQGCAKCLVQGTSWVHLRLCLTCGHVGCCETSPMRHAREHAMACEHPIISSLEPGERWRSCFVHATFV